MTRTPKTSENIEAFLLALETPSRDLTSWEEDFLDSLREQVQDRGSLSDRQFEILERIYAEKTA